MVYGIGSFSRIYRKLLKRLFSVLFTVYNTFFAFDGCTWVHR